MTANGSKASSPAMECGKASTMKATLENGKTPNARAMECMSGPMATAMRANGKDVLSTATEGYNILSINLIEH